MNEVVFSSSIYVSKERKKKKNVDDDKREKGYLILRVCMCAHAYFKPQQVCYDETLYAS